MRHAATHVTVELFPETLELAGTTLCRSSTASRPGHPLDGLTLTVPLSLLNQLDDARLTWLVPGMIREKVTHYLKALPEGVAQPADPAAGSRHRLPRVPRTTQRRRCRMRCAATCDSAWAMRRRPTSGTTMRYAGASRGQRARRRCGRRRTGDAAAT